MGLTFLFLAHCRELPVCVLGAQIIVMGQFIIYIEPTNAFAIMNVFIGGVGTRIVQRSYRNIHIILSALEDLGVSYTRKLVTR